MNPLAALFSKFKKPPLPKPEANVPFNEAIPGLQITPKPGVEMPVLLSGGRAVVNPRANAPSELNLPTMADFSAPSAPRLAKRGIKEEFLARQQDAAGQEVHFDSPTDRARFDYVTSSGAEMPKRSFKTSLLSALAGAAQANRQSGGDPMATLGGAVAGGVGGTISPTAGREVLFETAVRPEIEAREQGNLQRLLQGLQQRKATGEAVYAEQRPVLAQGEYERDDALAVHGMRDKDLRRGIEEGRATAANDRAAAATALDAQRLKDLVTLGPYKQAEAANKVMLDRLKTQREQLAVELARAKNPLEIAAKQKDLARTDALIANTQASTQRTRVLMSKDELEAAEQRRNAGMVFPAAQVVPYAQDRRISEAEARARIEAEGYTIR